MCLVFDAKAEGARGRAARGANGHERRAEGGRLPAQHLGLHLLQEDAQELVGVLREARSQGAVDGASNTGGLAARPPVVNLRQG